MPLGEENKIHAQLVTASFRELRCVFYHSPSNAPALLLWLLRNVFNFASLDFLSFFNRQLEMYDDDLV